MRTFEASFNADGDITDLTARQIGAMQCDRALWLQACKECWNTSYGRVTHGYDGTVEFVTGGWSANEAVISAMKKNHVMWSLCWESSHRGGLYVFRER